MSDRVEVLYDCEECETRGSDTMFCSCCVPVEFIPASELESLRAEVERLKQYREEDGQLIANLAHEIVDLRAENERLMDGFEPCDDEIYMMAVELIKRDKRITELERELNPDPGAHLMGWEGDDE